MKTRTKVIIATAAIVGLAALGLIVWKVFWTSGTPIIIKGSSKAGEYLSLYGPGQYQTSIHDDVRTIKLTWDKDYLLYCVPYDSDPEITLSTDPGDCDIDITDKTFSQITIGFNRLKIPWDATQNQFQTKNCTIKALSIRPNDTKSETKCYDASKNLKDCLKEDLPLTTVESLKIEIGVEKTCP